MRQFTLVAVLATALASGTALAQAPDTGTGRASGGGNIVGGGVATLSGGGDDMVITYSAGGAGGAGGLREQAGRVATFAGADGEAGPRFAYGASSAPAALGREAWVTGGGDNAQVVYADPAPSGARRR